MKATVISLSLVVVMLMTTTWLLRNQLWDQDSTTQEPIVSTVTEVQSEQTVLIEQQAVSPQAPTLKQSVDSTKSDNSNNSQQELAATQTVNREKTVEQLQDRFRLLESQYGVLSVDDIQGLEESLDDVEKIEDLTDFSYALDDLIYE